MPLSRIGLSQNQQITGNVAFQGTGNRITGDFSNALASRVAFQTSTTNGNTILSVLPNGTAFTSSLDVFNSSDTANHTRFRFLISNTENRLGDTIVGTGTYLPMTFYTGGSETARFSSTAKTFILAGGSTSATGTGITFPASQNASSDPNTLDDYEEGTWTPVDGSGASLTFTNVAGVYTKVGRVVTCQFNINYPSTANGSMSSILGLPFATSTQYGGLNNPSGGFITYTDSNIVITAPAGAGSTGFNFWSIAGGQISNASLSAKGIRMTLIYIV
jgi:hypothetical protein